MMKRSPSTTPSSFNLWEHKPWWCQPWSILLAGITIIAASWLVTHTLWLTVIVSMPILLWWTYFLVILPQFLKHNSAILTPPKVENTGFSEQD